MENIFKDIKYGSGNRPYCRFFLSEPINAGVIGNVYCIDVVLSDDETHFDVWVVSNENDRVYYRSILKKVPSNVADILKQSVLDAVKLTRECTNENRKANHAHTVDNLREEVRKIVSDYVKHNMCEWINKYRKQQF